MTKTNKPAARSKKVPSPPQARTKSKVVVDQRILLGKADLAVIEERIRLERHVERYALLRQFAKGAVCDAACGSGYGSHLLSTNPDVDSVLGLDVDAEAIAFAKREHASAKTRFARGSLATYVSPEPIDMLVSVETIEHLEDPKVLPRFVDRNHIGHVIITYPSKKTTHYNRFHHHDFRVQDVLDLFGGFTCYRHFNWRQEFDVVFLLRG